MTRTGFTSSFWIQAGEHTTIQDVVDEAVNRAEFPDVGLENDRLPNSPIDGRDPSEPVSAGSKFIVIWDYERWYVFLEERSVSVPEPEVTEATPPSGDLSGISDEVDIQLERGEQ